MKKGITITNKNIGNVIKTLRKKTQPTQLECRYFLLPTPKWVLNKDRYKGYGRPKKLDYDWVDLVTEFKHLNSLSPTK